MGATSEGGGKAVRGRAGWLRAVECSRREGGKEKKGGLVGSCRISQEGGREGRSCVIQGRWLEKGKERLLSVLFHGVVQCT